MRGIVGLLVLGIVSSTGAQTEGQPAQTGQQCNLDPAKGQIKRCMIVTDVCQKRDGVSTFYCISQTPPVTTSTPTTPPRSTTTRNAGTVVLGTQPPGTQPPATLPPMSGGLVPGPLPPPFILQPWMCNPNYDQTNGINHDPYTGDIAPQTNRLMWLDYCAEVVAPVVLDWALAVRPKDGNLVSRRRNADSAFWGDWNLQDVVGACEGGSGRAFECAGSIYQRDRAYDYIEFSAEVLAKYGTAAYATLQNYSPSMRAFLLQATDLRADEIVGTVRQGGGYPLPQPQKNTPKELDQAGLLHCKTPHTALTPAQCDHIRLQLTPAHMACSTAIITEDANAGGICGRVAPLARTLLASARTWDERTQLLIDPFPTFIDWGPTRGGDWTDVQRAARKAEVASRFRKADSAFMDWGNALCPGPGTTPGPIDGHDVLVKKKRHARQHHFIASARTVALKESCGAVPVNGCPTTGE